MQPSPLSPLPSFIALPSSQNQQAINQLQPLKHKNKTLINRVDECPEVNGIIRGPTSISPFSTNSSTTLPVASPKSAAADHPLNTIFYASWKELNAKFNDILPSRIQRGLVISRFPDGSYKIDQFAKKQIIEGVQSITISETTLKEAANKA